MATGMVILVSGQGFFKNSVWCVVFSERNIDGERLLEFASSFDLQIICK